MRIVSLVPHATEWLFALGLEEEIVGVTHECDYPWAATQLPHVTRARLPDHVTAIEIDRAVKAYTGDGEALYELDRALLEELAPDLIVTQELCGVCAVSHDEVVAIAAELPSTPEVVALDPHTVGEALGDLRTLAQHTDRKDEAVDLLEELAARIDRVRLASRGADRPRVLTVEWLDPLFIGGHWVPQQIDYAGGEDVLGLTGEASTELDWAIAEAAAADLVLVMPCGFDLDGAYDQALQHGERLARLGAGRVVAVDGSAYFSRPGPRLIDGLELLSFLLHPTSGIQPPEHSWRDVR